MFFKLVFSFFAEANSKSRKTGVSEDSFSNQINGSQEIELNILNDKAENSKKTQSNLSSKDTGKKLWEVQVAGVRMAVVLYMSSNFWLLGVESRDFSHHMTQLPTAQN